MFDELEIMPSRTGHCLARNYKDFDGEDSIKSALNCHQGSLSTLSLACSAHSTVSKLCTPHRTPMLTHEVDYLPSIREEVGAQVNVALLVLSRSI